MTTENYIDRLVENGVLQPVTGPSLELTESFDAAVTEQTQSFEAGDMRTLDSIHPEWDEVKPLLDDVVDEDPRFVAQTLVLADRLNEEELNQVLGIAVVLHQSLEDSPRAEGSPEGFIPIDGEDLPMLLKVFGLSIVYIWREDCPPCDAVRDEYEVIAEALPEEVTRFAVYGPKSAELLYDEYDVEGAPVSLFMRGADVDVRHVGIHDRNTILNEAETLLRVLD